MGVVIIGTGYVGLVTGACFAEMGNKVTCVDIDEKKIQRLRIGDVPIYEPGLEALVHKNVKNGNLSFTTNLKDAVSNASVIFLALPTPPNEDGSADLSYVLGVADDLGKIIDSYVVVVDKSTVPVGTAEKVREHIAANASVDFDVASNPEFLREGFAVSDFMRPDRVVIGTASERAKKLFSNLYAPFVRQGNPVIFMDERSAEMTKYAANSFLAAKISFMNEIANLCERVGADVDAVRKGIGTDQRIGNRFLFPGIGYGGSCFPKDVLALQRTAKENSYNFKILKAVTQVNELQKKRLVEKIMSYYEDRIKGKRFALWGLAFKPDTDDIREAPALDIIEALTSAGATIKAYDPEAVGNVKKLLAANSSLSFADDKYDALKDADALIIATEWSKFRTPDFDKIKSSLAEPIIFDGRNIYELDDIVNKGIYYASIGRDVVHG